VSRDRAVGIGLALAAALIAALVVSLALGLRGHPADGADEARVLAADQPPPGERVRVEVLNASGTSGQARRATGILRDAGFDVVFYGNAPGSFSPDSSLVLDRVGRLEHARAVARRLGIREVRTEVDAGRFVEATVVIGRDWQ
jgi:hypothetical protein